MENFFINYLSNQSNLINKYNSNQNFKVCIPHDLLSGRLDQQKLLVGIKFISFTLNEQVNDDQIFVGIKSSLVIPGNRTDGNQTQILHQFQLKKPSKTKKFSEYIEKPSFFTTTRQDLLSAEFEFLEYTSSGKFESARADFLLSTTPVHIQVEVKQLSEEMELDHINLLASSADPHSKILYPDNNAYNFTYEAPHIRLREDQKWVMGLKSIQLPSLVKNAYDPTQCWIRYGLRFTPFPNKECDYLPFEEFYAGPLRNQHYNNQQELIDDLRILFRTQSYLRGAIKVAESKKEGITVLMSRAPEYLIKKANLLKRENPDSVGLFENLNKEEDYSKGDKRKIDTSNEEINKKVKVGGTEDESNAMPAAEVSDDGVVGLPPVPVDDDLDDDDDDKNVNDKDDDDDDDDDDEKDNVFGFLENVLNLVVGEADDPPLKKQKPDPPPPCLSDDDDRMRGDRLQAKKILIDNINDAKFEIANPSKEDYPFEDIAQIVKDENLDDEAEAHLRRLAHAKLQANHDIYLYFELSPVFAKMLGIPLDKAKYEISGDSWYHRNHGYFQVVNSNVTYRPDPPDTILLNCDILSHTLVGNNKFPVLRHLYLGKKKYERDKLQSWFFQIDHFQEIVVRSNPFRMRLYLTDLNGIPLQLQDDQVEVPGLDNLVFVSMKRVA